MTLLTVAGEGEEATGAGHPLRGQRLPNHHQQKRLLSGLDQNRPLRSDGVTKVGGLSTNFQACGSGNNGPRVEGLQHPCDCL